MQVSKSGNSRYTEKSPDIIPAPGRTSSLRTGIQAATPLNMLLPVDNFFPYLVSGLCANNLYPKPSDPKLGRALDQPWEYRLDRVSAQMKATCCVFLH